VMSGTTTTAHKQLQSAVRIEVGGGQGTARLRAIGQDRLRCARFEIPSDEAQAIARVGAGVIAGTAVFVSLAHDKRLGGGLSQAEGENAAEISGLGAFQPSCTDGPETAFGIVAEERQSSTASGANGQVFPTVSIEVLPGQSRSELTQPLRQERLAREIVEGTFHMS